MKSSNRFFVFCGLFLVLLGLFPAFAQVDYATATLKGTVIDPGGAVINGATVTVTNTGTGVVKTAKSGPNGSYQVPVLPPGAYEIAVEAKGFAKEVARGVQITVGQIQVYDVHMKVGIANEVVEVAPDAIPLIQSEQTQQANTINQLQVTELPNPGRSILNQVYTLPGVGNSDATRSQTPGFTGFFGTGFSIGGSNGRNNLSTVDGGENEYGTGTYRWRDIPVEAIQEYQVNRNGFAAEFGFTDGSAINIVTKSGSKQLHGSLFGHFSDHSTSAANFFNGLTGLPKAFSQNVFSGFTLGGPIQKEKWFYYLAYEYQKLDIPDYTTALSLGSPTVLGLSNPLLGNNNPAGNCASQFANFATTKFVDQLCYVNALKSSGDPFLVGFGNGITPGLSPLNNPALNTILTRDSRIFNNPFRHDNALLRFDGTPTDNDTLGLRLGYVREINTYGNPDSNSSLFVRDFSVLGTWTRTLSTNAVNQALVQVVPQNKNDSLPNTFNGANFTLGALSAATYGSSTFGSPALLPYVARQKRYQFEDNITWIKGAHTLKFGASVRLADYHVENDLFFNPRFDFNDGLLPLISLAPAAVQAHLVGFNLANGFPATGPQSTNLSAPQSFAFGLPVDELAGFNNPVWEGWGKYYGSYFQDSWKVNSRLTMNLGVRLDDDAEPPPNSSNFYASPRLGFAWDLAGDHKTVIRAGGGLYVAPVDVLIPSYGSLLDGTGRYINEVLTVLTPTDPRVAQLWQLGVAKGELPFGRLTPADYAAVGININTPGATIGYSVNPNYKNPYAVEGSLSIDRQLANNLSLELGYNMYHGVHLQMPLETAYAEIAPGNPLCPTLACTDATGGPLYAPSTGQFAHTTYESIGSSIYHGLTASLTKRYSRGLQFQANYTWSKTLDNVIDFASFQDWFRPGRLSLYRAPSVFDIPHTFVANAVYTTPFKTSQGNFLARALADIAIAPIVTVRSGLPFSFRTPSVVNKINGQVLDNNFATPFAAPRDGNRGAAYASTDLRFTKSVFINRDRGVKVDFLAEGSNIFNRVNFNRVSDEFDNGLSLAGTTTAPNLLTGPFKGLHGVRPVSPLDIQHPLSFASADFPRVVQFGMRLAF